MYCRLCVRWFSLCLLNFNVGLKASVYIKKKVNYPNPPNLESSSNYWNNSVKTRFSFRDGETVSHCTKKKQIVNEEEVDYGRHIDLLVTSEQVEDDDDVELGFIEFKKANESDSVLSYQQSKIFELMLV